MEALTRQRVRSVPIETCTPVLRIREALQVATLAVAHCPSANPLLRNGDASGLAGQIVDQIKPVLGACTPVWGVGRLCAHARRRGKGDFEASRFGTAN